MNKSTMTAIAIGALTTFLGTYLYQKFGSKLP